MNNVLEINTAFEILLFWLRGEPATSEMENGQRPPSTPWSTPSIKAKRLVIPTWGSQRTPVMVYTLQYIHYLVICVTCWFEEVLRNIHDESRKTADHLNPDLFCLILQQKFKIRWKPDERFFWENNAHGYIRTWKQTVPLDFCDKRKKKSKSKLFGTIKGYGVYSSRPVIPRTSVLHFNKS